MKKIIVATDFSLASLNAINYAADLAVATDSNIMVVHILQFPLTFGDIPVEAMTLYQQIEDVEEKLNDLKEQISIRTGAKINITTDVKIGGAVVPAMENYCRSVRPLFVVMGSHGHSAIERLVFGSNTITAMKKSSWPLIIVPGGATFKKLNNIGFACDLHNETETIPVEEIRMLVRQFNARLHVIHINTESKTKYTPDVIDECRQVQKMFQDLHPAFHLLINPNIEEGVRVFAEKKDLDLLIVIPRIHRFIENLFHRSYAKQLIAHAHVPVLSVHD